MDGTRTRDGDSPHVGPRAVSAANPERSDDPGAVSCGVPRDGCSSVVSGAPGPARIATALETATAAWHREPDSVALRRALLDVLRLLEEPESTAPAEEPSDASAAVSNLTRGRP